MISFNESRGAELSSTSFTETVEHHPYSLDLAPSGFYLLGPLKKHLAHRHFRNDAEIQEAVVKWLRDMSHDFFCADFDRLTKNIQKCYNDHYDYVEK
ncbi:hypothetical protein AVEN_155300-1 [Araneus ventricosus]|uniref:Histone-lysine N-methyltransferase SETMAR n=1 Tax=Araneus ventricosus TaxID=182803 RepID=A0A4Y2D6J6_ARAVE|nr:hypothetical protein AVEN_155300-1 [Araneus ventricosus]